MPDSETGKKEGGRAGYHPTIPPGYTRSVGSLSSLSAPGYTILTESNMTDHTARTVCTGTARVALEGRNTWVGDIPEKHERESVTDAGSSLRRVTHVPRGEQEQRSDSHRVTLLGYPLWYGTVVQSGGGNIDQQ